MEPTTLETNPRYAAPESSAPYSSLGWAANLNLSNSGTPDSARVNRTNNAPFTSDPRDTDIFHEIRDAEKAARESTVISRTLPDASGAGIGSESRFAPNPRSIPVPETRWTMRLNPVTGFIRNMLARTPKRFSGGHFSMADHERNYDILGMEPQRSSRSTYRASAPEYGLSVVDMPAETASAPNATLRALNVPSTSGAFRL